MKHPQYTQSFSTRIFEIKRLCGLARLVAQADSVDLVLHPGAWAGLAEPLIDAGVLARTEPADPTPRTDIFAPFRTDGQRMHNSDTVTVAVPVVAANATDLGRIILHQARPDAMSAALSAQLKKIGLLLAARLVAEADHSEDLPVRMLSLIEALAERDTEAGSRVVTGFLRLVAGRIPTKVEAMRLCIAGLAEPVETSAMMPHPTGLRLTAEAGRILSSIGLLAALPLSQDLLPVAQDDVAPDLPPPLEDAPVFRAIANLSLGKSTYDIGETEDETCLAYRPAAAKAAWVPLTAGLADGWPEIATEIMFATQDTLKDYVFTHMIHERQEDGEVARVYSLYDLRWHIRPGEAGMEGYVEGHTEWQRLLQSSLSFADHPRESAYAALLELMPGLGLFIQDDVRAWLRRLSAGATVVPIFMSQSA